MVPGTHAYFKIPAPVEVPRYRLPYSPYLGIYSCTAVPAVLHVPGYSCKFSTSRDHRFLIYRIGTGTLKLRQPRTCVTRVTKSLCTKSWNSGGTISKIMYMLAPQIIANLLCFDKFGLGLPVHQLFFFFLSCRYGRTGTA